ncbi:acyl-CoA thioesterase [Clostridium sp. BNL1100]|uniref:acyl-CoA thioesterase n=1 Tax=Clostridium sp. BNL1100 TaxID=755731 RepID=UPI00024A7D06|nr:acyl-CoA thioesterase [Clostridium sp. BNL1100]AEY67084.1 putative thioesterase [Clostridium sp. BNL1100]
MSKWYHEKHIVEFNECDPSKTVYNSKYFVWFENSRFAIAEQVQLSSYVEKIAREQGDSIIFPVLEAECKFLLPIPMGTHLILRTKLEKPKAAKLVFKHIATGEFDGKEYAVATTTVGVLSAKNGLHMSLDDNFKKLINDYLES